MPESLFGSNGQELRFGDWQFDLRNDEFADIKYQDIPILRSVRAVIRDKNWNTCNLVINDCKIVNSDDAKSVELSVSSIGFESSFIGTIKANFSDASAAIEMDLTSNTDYETNRTGLIVLHQPKAAGAELLVTHGDGNQEQTLFPKLISPHQPVFDIAALDWKQNSSRGSADVSLKFRGDVFEMEDQRNWTDASFKTYSRPLSKPFPYTVRAGEVISQGLKISIERASKSASEQNTRNVMTRGVGKGPDMQLGASTCPGMIPAFSEFVDVYLVELDLQSSNWQAALDRALECSKSLDVRVIYGPESDDELSHLVSKLHVAQVRRVAIFDRSLHVSTQETNSALLAALNQAGKRIPIISGARSHFTELNREQDKILANFSGSRAGVCFSSTPLFHSISTEQLMESVPMQRLTALQAVHIGDGSPVHIGPISLRPRFNNVATAPQPGPSKKDLSEGYGAEFNGSNDERQVSNELGSWVIAAAAALTVPGVESITWFEAWGPRGIRDTNGNEYPIAEALFAISQFAGTYLYIGNDYSEEVWVMASKQAGTWVLLASNIGDEEAEVEVFLDGSSKTLILKPFSWVQELIR